MWYRNLISSTYARTLLIVMCLIAPQFGLAQANVGSALRGILRPASSAVQYNYVMTASIRLLLFWVGADDVGGGYIRRSTFERKKGGKVSKTYTNLMELEFSTLNQSNGERTEFEILVGTTGTLEGVPVQIVHQPNWWFKVVLDLDDVVRKNP